MDQHFEDTSWEALPNMDDSAKELKKIRKNLRKRNLLIVLTSLLLVAAMLFGAVQYGIPALESRYWDPNVCTYADYTSDLTFTFMAYTELFCPGINTASVNTTDTGFASHNLTLVYNDPQKLDLHYLSGTLNQNVLRIPDLDWSHVPGGTFIAGRRTNKDRANFIKELKSLPPYIKLYAAIGFENDISLDDLAAIATYQTNSDFRLDWAAVRVSDNSYPDCGFRPDDFTTWYDSSRYINDTYSKFIMGAANHSESNYKTHFNSLLQYSRDQQKNGIGIVPNIDNGESFYEDALAYVEENGYHVYGCCVVSSAENILALMEEGNINSVLILDAWIDL